MARTLKPQPRRKDNFGRRSLRGAGETRLLGITTALAATALTSALAAVEGPPVTIRSSGGLAALLQAEPAVPLFGRSRADLLLGLRCVQQRLEILCQSAPFLAADPAAACAPAPALAALLDSQADGLRAALHELGSHQQWDIVLRWTPDHVLAARRAEIAARAAGLDRIGLADAVAGILRDERARREAALIAALTPAVLAFAAGGAAGSETEIALTVLVAAGGEAAIEAALGDLPDEEAAGASVDMRGPLPPLSFAALRLTKVDPAALRRAWATLDVPPRVDLAGLHRHWRLRAFDLHPDRQKPGPVDHATALAEATESYHLLRDVMREGEARNWSLDELLPRAGYRLRIPQATVSEARATSVGTITRAEPALTAGYPAP